MYESVVTVPKFNRTMETIVENDDRSTVGPNDLSFGVTKSLDIIARLHENYSSMSETFTTDGTLENQRRDSLYVVVPITVIYVLIFFTGLIGNVSTCVVIARNRSMHTATNYYLFSLAVSDLLLLISGLPPEMYYIWSHYPYVFGEIFCIIQSFAAETSANATVLTITAFTVERYVAICHPFISHTMSKLSRAVKFVIIIWVLALCLAIPQAIQFGVVFRKDDNGTIIPETGTCSRKWVISDQAFEISTMLFFVAPMTIITVLYIFIGIKLRRSRLLTGAKRNPIACGINHSDSTRGRSSSQRNVIRMLVAVVVAFFICWAPFHAQRLLAVYAENSYKEPGHTALVTVYTALTYVSGIFYYLSTTVNPLLYNIMSHKFREAFKSMLSEHCGGRSSLHKTNSRRQPYSNLSRNGTPTARRGIDRNSASLSASDENRRLTKKISQEVVRQRDNDETREIKPVDGNESTQNLVSQINRERAVDCQKTNGNDSSDKLTTIKTESNSLVTDPSDSIPKIESCGTVVRTSKNNGFEIGLHNLIMAKGQQLPSKTVGLGLIAERLRVGTKNLFASQQPRPQNHAQQAHTQPPGPIVITTPEIVGRIGARFKSHPSLDSAKTISNASLRDVDETEFTGTELASYMGELNFDLVT